MSTIFGDPKVTAVLPSAEPEEAARFRELLKAWGSPSQVVEMVGDNEITQLPKDRSVWLLGKSNKLAARAVAHEGRFVTSADSWSLAGERLSIADHTGVVVVRHPGNPAKAVGWMVIAPRAAYVGVARKLPHYGRYSFLGFEGDEPTNTIKGEWATDDSPTRVDLRPAGAENRCGARGVLAVSQGAGGTCRRCSPLKALTDHVAFLAAERTRGTRCRHQGSRRGGRVHRRGVRETRVGAPRCGWLLPAVQRSTRARGDARHRVKNVIGVLKGMKTEWDETGRWCCSATLLLPRPRVARRARWQRRQAHPGADDNASGVAVMLELARVLRERREAPAPIVFAAFTGEEAGLRGSRYFVEHPGAAPLTGIRGVVNLDTVGRLRSGKVQVLGSGTATEWQHIFRGGSFVTGVESTAIPGNAEASDQLAFIKGASPRCRWFTGPHEDYHRPGDTADKVDVAGLVKVAALVKEAVVYLAERPEALPSRSRPSGARRTHHGQRRSAAASSGGAPGHLRRGAGLRIPGQRRQALRSHAGLTRREGRTEGRVTSSFGWPALEVFVARGVLDGSAWAHGWPVGGCRVPTRRCGTEGGGERWWRGRAVSRPSAFSLQPARTATDVCIPGIAGSGSQWVLRNIGPWPPEADSSAARSRT